MQLNSLFNVSDKLVNKTTSAKVEKIKDKVMREGKLIKGEVDQGTSSAVVNINQQLEDRERQEVIKFSKRYFGQVGRNYRVFYMKDDRMVYLHRMWFDQVRTPAQTIKSISQVYLVKKVVVLPRRKNFLWLFQEHQFIN